MAPGTKIRVAALVSATVAVMMVALTLATVTASAAQSIMNAYEFTPVGGSGLRGLGYVIKSGGKIRVQATLACAQACPTGSTGNGVPVRLKFAEGGCGKPKGESFALNFDKIDGFDSRSTRSFDPDNDPLTFWNSMRAAWDLDNNGAFEGAACAPKGGSYYYADGGWYYDYAYSG